ncbi:hypothetical protein PQ472_10815 [Lacticaseibacillus pabuli]|uniref:Rgg/GadR/MutR family transcriptional activator n=1 Tax=Lacticaseibacillus pabuli TaxID=3025672 RepID=A0ABY7WQA0_9LACO|nr:hypothetical protein [Lacticaseibacillus sp. KACC 23028]WDF82367.1 hypothetical protein PQ472_10815 [Lacticaseibacillus sp. KACC 23028]
MMNAMQLGTAFHKIRGDKDFTLTRAGNREASVNLLSQFERGESGISFRKLNCALNNLNVGVEEYLAQPEIENGNWIERWCYELDAYQRGEIKTPPDGQNAPERWRNVTRLIGRLAAVTPAKRRKLLTKQEVQVLTRVITLSKHYGEFVNIVIFYAAHLLPNTIRRVATQRLASANEWTVLTYMRPATTTGALWALAEAEIYMKNCQKAEIIMHNLAERIMSTDVYERVALRVLESELYLARGDVEAAKGVRDGVLATLKVLGDGWELNRFEQHYQVVWSELGGELNE